MSVLAGGAWPGMLVGWALVAAAGIVGWPLTRAVRALQARLAASLLGGLAVVWLGLWTLDAVGIGWTRGSLLVLISGLLLAAWLLGRSGVPRSETRASSSARVDLLVWTIVVAAAAVLAAAAAMRLAVHPDFVFHWGIKGARYFLEGGVDVEYLGRPWNRHVHPDYPGLLPGLFAATAILFGRFELPAMLGLAMPFLVVLLLGVDLLLVRLGASAAGRVAGVATVAGGVLAFSLGFPDRKSVV